MLSPKRKNKLATAVLLFTLSVPVLSYADRGDGGRPQGPPPEAIESCKSLSVGDACSFSGRRGEDLAGTCINPGGDEDTLACAPKGGPRH